MVTLTRPLSFLRPNPLNPRGPVDPASVQELADSIRTQGILQPLLITPDGVIVAGHRRHAAARVAGLAEVPVVERDLTELQQLEAMVVENMQRQDLSLLQEARAFQLLLEKGVSRMDLARRVGLPHGTIDGRLVILRLAPEVQELYGENALPLTAARPLAAIADWERQRRLARMVADRTLTVPQLEALQHQGSGIQEKAPPVPETGSVAFRRGEGPDRNAVQSALYSAPTQVVTFARLATVMDAVCCACGVQEARPELCRQCPIPKLLSLIVQPPRGTRPGPASKGFANAR